MRRVHLFEIEDQPWCPAVLRDGGTAYLTFFSRLTGILGGAEPQLRKLLAASKDGRFLDLCSGAAGPTQLVLELVPEARAHCTDLFPNTSALERAAAESDRLTFSPEPVDATAVPAELTGARTLFRWRWR